MFSAMASGSECTAWISAPNWRVPRINSVSGVPLANVANSALSFLSILSSVIASPRSTSIMGCGPWGPISVALSSPFGMAASTCSVKHCDTAGELGGIGSAAALATVPRSLALLRYVVTFPAAGLVSMRIDTVG